jgi:hypothetical protein
MLFFISFLRGAKLRHNLKVLLLEKDILVRFPTNFFSFIVSILGCISILSFGYIARFT